jgi:FkbM family methyltransferase
VSIRDLIRATPIYRLIRPFRNRYRELSRQRHLAAEERKNFWKMTEEDRRRLEFYSQFVRRGDLVFDVGANQGNRAKVFLELGCRVIAFEPQRACSAYLQTVMQGRKHFQIVQAALGPAEGTAEMLVSDVHVLSSLSKSWIDATKASGRFASIHWDTAETVAVKTLDWAIAEFGLPTFIKIDVEGFEFEVLAGLSTPPNALSIEFTAEYLENTYKCIEHLSGLGLIEGQLSHGESLEFFLDRWVDADQLKSALDHVPSGSAGDVYVRFVP